jgi:hypothetical protein
MSVVSGIVGANAAEEAADTMSDAQYDATAAGLESSEMAANAQLEGMMYGADAQLQAAAMSADAIKESTRMATETQWKMYAQSREDQAPWLQAGKRALGTLESMLAEGPGEFKEDPGYQFRLAQGNKQLTANAAATGNLASGRTLKALTEYGQDYASNEYDKFINRYYQSLTPYQSLAGLGMTTAGNMGNQAIQAGNAVADLTAGAGRSLAGIYQNTGNGLANIYTSGGNAMANSYMNAGNIAAQGALAQGNIAAWGSMNSSNAWTGAINSGLQGISSYYSNNNNNSGYYGGASGGNWNSYSPGATETGTGYNPDNYM